MDPVDLLRELGGAARRSALLTVLSRAELRQAVAAGLVVRDARGVYVLPEVDEGVRAAVALRGALGLTSAALRHGWAVAEVPDKPHVMLSRGRKLPPRARERANVHWSELKAEQVVDGVTTEDVTLEHCLRHLPYTEALAVADSALREGFGPQALERLAARVVGPGSRQVRLVGERADARAANPFESTLRGISHSVEGLSFEPQLWVTDTARAVRPDLVDVRLRLIAEADSFEFHGHRSALAADTRRYNMLIVAGWIVLRFCYEDVMFRPEEVRRTLLAAVAWAELLKIQTDQMGSAA